VRVRNVATVGGHLSHGDPHMDLPPLLSALDASVSIARSARRAQLPGREPLCRLTWRHAEEARSYTRLTVPPMGERARRTLKCTTRSADDWPALGVAVVLDGEKHRHRGEARPPTGRRGSLPGSGRGLRIESDLHGWGAAYKKQLVRV